MCHSNTVRDRYCIQRPAFKALTVGLILLELSSIVVQMLLHKSDGSMAHLDWGLIT